MIDGETDFWQVKLDGGTWKDEILSTWLLVCCFYLSFILVYKESLGFDWNLKVSALGNHDDHHSKCFDIL